MEKTNERKKKEKEGSEERNERVKETIRKTKMRKIMNECTEKIQGRYKNEEGKKTKEDKGETREWKKKQKIIEN